MTVSSKKAATKKKRSVLKVQKRRLVFPNPYRTTAFLNPSGPPLKAKLDLARGVQSVEQAEKQKDMQFMVQRYNAGILNQRERALKALADEEKARKTNNLIQKYLKSTGLSKEQIEQKYGDSLKELSKKLTQAQDREDDIPLRFENELDEFKKRLESKTKRYLDSDPSKPSVQIRTGDIYPTYFRDLEQMKLAQMIENQREATKSEKLATQTPRLYQGSVPYRNPQDARLYVDPYSDRYANMQQRAIDERLEKVQPTPKGLVSVEPLDTKKQTEEEKEEDTIMADEIEEKTKEKEEENPEELRADQLVEVPKEAAAAATAAASSDYPPNASPAQIIATEQQKFRDAVTDWYKAWIEAYDSTPTVDEQNKKMEELREHLEQMIYEQYKTLYPKYPDDVIRSKANDRSNASLLEAKRYLNDLRSERAIEQMLKEDEERAQKAADGNTGSGVLPLVKRLKPVSTINYGGRDLALMREMKQRKMEEKERNKIAFRKIHEFLHDEAPSYSKVMEAFPDKVYPLDVSNNGHRGIPSRKIFKHSFLRDKGIHF